MDSYILSKIGYALWLSFGLGAVVGIVVCFAVSPFTFSIFSTKEEEDDG